MKLKKSEESYTRFCKPIMVCEELESCPCCISPPNDFSKKFNCVWSSPIPDWNKLECLYEKLED